MTRQPTRRTSIATAPRSVGIVGERQVRVIASDATPDRMGDILDPFGVKLDNYRRNPVVLFGHDQMQPIARCSVAVEGAAVVATIDFPAAGVSERSDEVLRLLKAGILGAVSVGFLPLKWEPIKGAGLRFTSWELLELSVVSVPANPSALVTARSFHESTPDAGDDEIEQLRLRAIRRRQSLAGPIRRAADDGPEHVETKADRLAAVAAIRLQHGLQRRNAHIEAAMARFRLGLV